MLLDREKRNVPTGEGALHFLVRQAVQHAIAEEAPGDDRTGHADADVAVLHPIAIENDLDIAILERPWRHFTMDLLHLLRRFAEFHRMRQPFGHSGFIGVHRAATL
jgi:hypothetical protein